MKSFCVLLPIFIASISALPTQNTGCGKPTDVVFLVDASSSIGRRNFGDHVRPFLKDVVDVFDIGPGPSQTRVGVVTFSDFHQLQFHLNDFTDKETLKEKILNIPINGGNTNTGEALTFVTEEMFKAEHGSREGVTKVIIILTDGASQDFEATRLAAKKTHEYGFRVFAIGVGSLIDNRELEDLASDPDSEYKYNVTNFKALEQIKSIIAERTCEVTTLRAEAIENTSPMSTSTVPSSISTRTTSATSGTSVASAHVSTDSFLGDQEIRTIACGGKPAEVYFILDSSGSIEKEDFSVTTLDFVRSVTSLFDIGPEKTQTRVGIVTFSHDVSQIFPLDAHTTHDDLLKAISPENIPHKARGTNTADALRFVTEKGFAPDVARPDVVHVAIVITDGQSQNVDATVEAAKAAHRSGIYVFAIGVGPVADVQELKDIASEPDSKFVFTVPSYPALMSIRNLLAIRTCTVEDKGDFKLKDQAECSLDDTELLYVYDSFTLGLRSTRLISTEASQMSATLSRQVENLRAGMLSESCPSGLDMELRNAATFARQAMHLQDTVSTKLVNLIKDARRKWFDRKKKTGRKVMVLYVDETSLENAADLRSQTRNAKFIGIEIYVVALGDVNTKLVDELASTPTNDHVINVHDARHLPKFRNMIMTNLCYDHQKAKTTENVEATTKMATPSTERFTLLRHGIA